VNGGRRTAVYIWDRMATALKDLGVEAKTPEWTCLVGKAAANAAPVAYVLDGKGLDGKGAKGSVKPTREALDEALSVLFLRNEDGVLIPEQKKKAADIKAAIAKLKGEDAETETGDGADDSNAAEEPKVFDLLLGGLKYASDNLDQITDRAQFEALVPLIRMINTAAKNVDAATKVADAS